jgi:hypothetical protein
VKLGGGVDTNCILDSNVRCDNFEGFRKELGTTCNAVLGFAAEVRMVSAS